MGTEAVAKANNNAGKEHEWVYAEALPKSDWEYRDCSVCGLHDERSPSNPTHHRHWQVTTPCIEAVPDTMTFEMLIAELETKRMRGRKYPDAHYNLQPYAMGSPDQWLVGFRMGGQHDGVELVPAIETLNLEQGWAKLLRWLRAREYSLYSHRNYQSTGITSSQTIRPASCEHHDDD